jgi:hypothetical protein
VHGSFTVVLLASIVLPGGYANGTRVARDALKSQARSFIGEGAEPDVAGTSDRPRNRQLKP